MKLVWVIDQEAMDAEEAMIAKTNASDPGLNWTFKRKYPNQKAKGSRGTFYVWCADNAFDDDKSPEEKDRGFKPFEMTRSTEAPYATSTRMLGNWYMELLLDPKYQRPGREQISMDKNGEIWGGQRDFPDIGSAKDTAQQFEDRLESGELDKMFSQKKKVDPSSLMNSYSLVWGDLLREYGAGWIGGGTATGMSPIGDNPNLKRNFSTQGRGRGWPYDDEVYDGDEQQMNPHETEGNPGFAAGTQMRPSATGRPPTPDPTSWESGMDPDDALDPWKIEDDVTNEAMGLPINFGMSQRGGQQFAGAVPAQAGWGHATSNFKNGEEDGVPSPPPVDNEFDSAEEAGKMPSIWDKIAGLREAEEMGFGEEKEESQETPEHEASETPEEESSEHEESSDPGEFQLEPDVVEIEFEDEPGSDEPAEGDEPEEGDEELSPGGDVAGFFGQETGEEPPDMLGPMNPYPPEAEPVANVGQEYMHDQTDDELENRLDRIWGDEDNQNFGDPAPSAAPDGGQAGIKNPLDLFALPSAWDNVELILRGSKHPAPAAPAPAVPVKK